MEETRHTHAPPTGNEPAGAAAGRGVPRGWWRPVALIAAVVLILVLARVFGLGERLGGIRMWIQSLGTWGYGAFVILYALAVVAALPGAAITVAAGALYGSVIGVILVSIGSTLGASIAFIMSRYFARDATARWLAKNERLQQLDLLTERHGAVIVAITRLIPLFPFNLLNYAFGLTRVPFGTYVFWSLLCMLPGTVLYVVGADALTKGVMQGSIPWPLIFVLVAVALLLVFLTMFARKKLSEKKADAP
ncbi:MAG TPA: TVP38/TMEM64 family protein [Syntrophales bacterium]|nr:TVP38/TMEM64 family protein [Syntrophales bacterium]HOX93188.1 TVP38/TMEM64 family protein [Syntrophales bacterium]HPI57634.1 TVP38/TMEM64 family protein [Syntrophales bacterium]HPN25353.1 TVP38/TMEM64 family protein [Syntrophales bacterium]HQM29645.1 TVP38/TMEM64 family protein [Syntrophales bacterium]